MHVSLRTALVLFATTAVAAGACGGNVVVDTPTGSTGIANGGAANTTGTEPETTDTTVTGFGTTGTGFGTTGTGFGGSDTTGTGFGASTTTGTGFGSTTVSVSASSSTGTGVGGSGACTSGLDPKVLSESQLYADMVQCAMQAPGNAAANTMCLEATPGLGGLSSQCLSCIVSDLECSLATCATPCIANPDSEACITCRNGPCAASFRSCSGFSDAPGSTTCADELTSGTKGMGWRRGIPGEAFLTQGGFAAYSPLDQCACDTPSMLCAGACGDNFCVGAAAAPECLMCLESTCNSWMQKCSEN